MPVPVLTIPSPPIPTLTPEERERAVALVAADPFLRQVLDGRSYEVLRVGLWTTGGRLETIGAVVEIRLAEPLTVEADWPTVVYDEYDEHGQAYGWYRSTRRRYGVEEIDRLSVSVDLHLGQVVGVHPGPGSGRVVPPAQPGAPSAPSGR